MLFSFIWDMEDRFFSLQQLFKYIKIVTRISISKLYFIIYFILLYFYYISIMLSSSTYFSISLQALCLGSMITYISTCFFQTFATLCSRGEELSTCSVS